MYFVIPSAFAWCWLETKKSDLAEICSCVTVLMTELTYIMNI